MSSPGGAQRYSFAPAQHEASYQPMSHANDHNRSVSPSSGKNKFWPFNRSRSASPNEQAAPGRRSRKTSGANSPNGRAGSPAGFVVRTVTRQPGGVSAPTSPAADDSYRPDWTRVAQPSQRRMTLEDSDEDTHHAPVQNGQHQLQYKRSKSRPISSALSLSVPAGGPGGGVGYGTATSSNDGRPEPFHSPRQPQPPSHRPSSPGASMTAGGFQKSLQDRGRSPRKTPSGQALAAQHAQQNDRRSPSPSINSNEAGTVVTPSGKVIRPLITPGPKSLAQQSTSSEDADSTRPPLSARTSMQSMRPQGIAGPRQFPGGGRPSIDAGQQGPPAPVSPHEPPHTQPFNRQPSPLGFSQSPGRAAPSSATSNVHANGRSSPMRGPASPSQFANAAGAEAGERSESPGRSRKFSFGFSRGRKTSDAAAAANAANAAGPLDGLPSPVDIPYGRKPASGVGARSRSRDPGVDTDYSYENGASPFGSVSPAGSPGFLSSLAAARGEGGEGNDGRSGSPGGSGLAGKWFKGIFGRSPRAEEGDQDWRGAPMYPDGELGGARSREESPLPALPPHATEERQALAPRQPPNQGRRSQTLPNPPSEDDVEALLQKRQSMKQARKIVDAERRELMSSNVQRGFDPDKDREFRPKQAVDISEDHEARFEAERRRSPPGRKPVPRLPSGSQDSALGRLEDRLTPAQRIIQETRSMHLARESLEAQRGSPRTNADRQHSDVQPGQSHASAVPSAEAQPTPNQPEIAVRRGANGGSSKGVGKARAPLGSASEAPPAASAPRPQQQPGKAPAGSRVNGGSALSPGSGPMPLDMTLPQALQEMMVRFYRFERYSVPLIRSLETRLLDIEHDAMMASNPQSGARGNVETASQHEEMDRWVGQMTKLMKHEVGQLKAAAKEIREGRELVAQVAKGLGGIANGGVGMSGSLATFSSIGTLPSINAPAPAPAQAQAPVAASTAALTPVKAIEIEAKGVTDSPSSTKGDTGIQPPSGSPRKQPSGSSSTSAKQQGTPTEGHDASRRTNVSSSSFRSAVPLTPSKARAATSNLVLPPGAKPALDKDEGKFGSPTKATFGYTDATDTAGQASGAPRERSLSPSGRPRYTSALGQPMANGRLSPGGTSPVRNYPDAEARVGIASPGRWADDQRKFGQARIASPAVSDAASIHSGVSGALSEASRPRREISVEERLKALMDGTSIRSRASSFAGSLAGESTHEDAAEDEDAAAAEAARVDEREAKIGDNYDPAPEGEVIQARPDKTADSDTVQERRRQNASQSTTATTSTSALTIRPNHTADARSAAAAAPDSPTRPLAVKRTTGEIAKRASAYLEASNAGTTTPTRASREVSPIDGPVSPIGFPSSAVRRSPSPMAVPNDTTAAADVSPAPSTGAGVRQRAMSYLSSAGGGGSSDDPFAVGKASSSATSSPPAAATEEDATPVAPESPSKVIAPGSWLASSSSSPSKATGSTTSGRISPSKLHVNRFSSPSKEGGTPNSPHTSPGKKVIGLPSPVSSSVGGGGGGGVGGGSASTLSNKWSVPSSLNTTTRGGRGRKESSTSSTLSSKTVGAATLSTPTTGTGTGMVVEKKRSFPLPPPSSAAAAAAKGPSMVGHNVSLKERVAFFDSVK